MRIEVPLISPISRKYYKYAQEKDNRKHYRAADIRICLEYVCDQIIFKFLPEQEKWCTYDLHDKLKASKAFLDRKIVDRLIKAKITGNQGVHEGEEGKYTEQDLENAADAIKEFSLEVFVSYFKCNGFGVNGNSWIPTVFSTLPPIYRVRILEKYYQKFDKSAFVIDKLSKAYVKSNLETKADEFLCECYKQKEITNEQYDILANDLVLLKNNLDKLPIANNLEMAKRNFNTLLTVIPEEERDTFVCLVSMILNGEDAVIN